MTHEESSDHCGERSPVGGCSRVGAKLERRAKHHTFGDSEYFAKHTVEFDAQLDRPKYRNLWRQGKLRSKIVDLVFHEFFERHELVAKNGAMQWQQRDVQLGDAVRDTRQFEEHSPARI